MLNKTFKNSFLLVLTLSLVLSVSLTNVTAASNQRTDYSGNIQVTGTAVINGLPDVAYVTLGVETKDPSAEIASQENANRMEKVFQALKELGLTDKDITTSGYNIYSSSQVIGRGTENEETIITYTVQNRINITTKDLDNVGMIIDVAIKGGANQVQGVRFDIEDKQAMQLEALKNAVLQGKAKAEVMAASAGIEIGGLANMSESYSTYAPMMDTMAIRSASTSNTTINPGEVEVTATVSMNYWF